MASGPHGVHEDSPGRSLAFETAPLSVIWPLLGRHIAFHRRLVDLTSSVKAALLLSQSIYWTRHGRDIARNGGWFHKTTGQWEMETGLSAKEQLSAREVLCRLELLEDQRIGVPARLQFRLNLDRLGTRLAERIACHPDAVDWSDRLVLAELLGPSVAFHRSLVGVAGGVHGGLLLSRALHLTRQQSGRRMDEWIACSAARWIDEIGLTRREQETARRDLVRAGLWEECLRGIPPSTLVRIRLDCLLALLTDDVLVAKRRCAGGTDPVSGVAADKVSPKGESRVWQPHSLDLPKPPNQFRPFRTYSSAETAKLLIKSSTGVSVQPPTGATAANAPDTSGGGGGDLIFPEQMLPDERQAARLLLRGSGDAAQSLLDELAGRLQMRSVRSSPVAYLRGLIARAAAGSFVPEMGPRVAAARARQQSDVAQRLAHESEEKRLAAERDTPEGQARVLAQRQQLKQLLAELKARARTGGQP
jgi:hypothetical protein